MPAAWVGLAIAVSMQAVVAVNAALHVPAAAVGLDAAVPTTMGALPVVGAAPALLLAPMQLCFGVLLMLGSKGHITGRCQALTLNRFPLKTSAPAAVPLAWLGQAALAGLRRR